MTDEEIIKGLNELAGYTGLQEKYIQALSAVLDLIDRQKTTIKNLRNVISNQQVEVSAKIEKQIKDEAYKEFAERLNEKAQIADYFNSYSMVVGTHFIDDLLKEMIGEDNA